MLLLFFIFVLLFIIISLVIKKYESPYKVIFYQGKIGSGKTTTLQKDCLEYISKGWTVYSDTELYGAIKISLKDIGRFRPKINSVFIIDEIGLAFNNRNWKNNIDSDLLRFLKLIRHYKCSLIMASQSQDYDKVLRDLCTDIYIIENWFNIISVRKKVIRSIDIVTTENGGDIVDSYEYAPIWTWKITFIPRYKFFFNSFDTPYLPTQDFGYYKYYNYQYLQKLTSKMGYMNYLKDTLLSKLEPRIERVTCFIQTKFKRGKPLYYKIDNDWFMLSALYYEN